MEILLAPSFLISAKRLYIIFIYDSLVHFYLPSNMSEHVEINIVAEGKVLDWTKHLRIAKMFTMSWLLI